MPRRKQNVDMYGKSWSPIDIPNLEKAVQLYERLNHLQNNFANSLAGSSKIWGQINEQADLQNELQKIGIKASKEQCEEILKDYCEDIRQTEAWCARIRQLVEDRIAHGESIKACKEVIGKDNE